MNIDQKTTIYAQVNASNQHFKQLLIDDREVVLGHLAVATDLVTIHRLQGKVILLDDQIAMLTNSHKFLRK